MTEPPDPLRAALVQRSCEEDPARNLDGLLGAIHEAAAGGASLVLLQELHNTVYFCQSEEPARFDLAEPVPGPTTEILGRLAAGLDIVIVGSVFERRAAGLYHNTAVVLDRDGRLAGRYRKMHIPDDPGYYEKFYFTPGDGDWRPIETGVGRLGVLVCWDQWYPEAARLMALAGAEMLLYPSAIGWDPGDSEAERQRQRDAWIIAQRAHAVCNGLPLLACNRVGEERDPSGPGRGIRFWGSSFACGPQGELLAQAASDRNQVLLADIERGRSERVRRIWPFLRDRRVDSYGDLMRRFRD